MTVSISNCAQHMPQSARDKLVTVVVDMTYYHGTGGHLARAQKSRMGTERGSSSHGHVCRRHLEQTDKCIHKHATHSATKHSHQRYTGMEVLNSIPFAPTLFGCVLGCEKECCYFYSVATCHFVMGISVHLKVLHSTVGWLFVVTCLCSNWGIVSLGNVE